MLVMSVVGSMRERSTTRLALATALEGARQAGAQVERVELRDLSLPICDGRSDVESYGGDVDRLRARLAEADALLVGSPEYYGSFSGALKNALDLAGSDRLEGKMVGLLAVARGDAGAMNTLNHLRHVLRWMGAWVLPTQVSVPRAHLAFDPEGCAVREGLEAELLQMGRELVRYAGLLAGNGSL